MNTTFNSLRESQKMIWEVRSTIHFNIEESVHGIYQPMSSNPNGVPIQGQPGRIKERKTAKIPATKWDWRELWTLGYNITTFLCNFIWNACDKGNQGELISLFHRIRASVTCYFLFNLQGKNAQIYAFFPSIKTLRKTNFAIILKWLGNSRNAIYCPCLC